MSKEEEEALRHQTQQLAAPFHHMPTHMGLDLVLRRSFPQLSTVLSYLSYSPP